jgi:Protein of unknown function (DUF3551)
MRKMTFPVLAGASIVILWVASSPAPAHDYNYCLLGRIWGYTGCCEFSTFQQCLVSSLKTGFGCVVNPRYALARPRRHHAHDPHQQ